MSMLLFFFWLALLGLEGFLIAERLLPVRDAYTRGALALPFAALTNVLLVFVLTVLHVPLSLLFFCVGHGLLIAGLIAARYRFPYVVSSADPIVSSWRMPQWLKVACMALLTVNIAFSFVHAILLPTVQIDSFTNWTMRSRVSFEDQAIAFDTNESRGVAKPQYPFLIHALQIVVQQGTVWHDLAANAVVYGLILSSFAAVFLLLRRLRGSDTALLTITLITGIPLLQMHLIPGYGDLPLLLFLLIALLALVLFRESSEYRWLYISGIAVLAATWTKLEGLHMGLVPYVLLIGFFAYRMPDLKKKLFKTGGSILAFSALFPVFLLVKGLPLTPGGSDAGFKFSSDALSALPAALFASGSFGITWFAIVSMLLFIVIFYHHPSVLDRSSLWTLFWGIFTLLGFLYIYTCTPNARFFLNHEAFYRQMLIPAAMLIVGFALVLKRPGNAE